MRLDAIHNKDLVIKKYIYTKDKELYIQHYEKLVPFL
ncbi:hypothetical protein FHR24_001893 [Wenyingzhuangia heitensis]|uniref:Uncharacterized protein n=1 Tax=Wenyingzhuangia heitensis TaxID=1487859 RepID=A0ABX0UBZ7_9FLAO|nr:hypothetical protein [Wenyingzhuangia heitensis]